MSLHAEVALPAETTARVGWEEALRWLKGGRGVRRQGWAVGTFVVLWAPAPLDLPVDEGARLARQAVLEQCGLMVTSPLAAGGRRYTVWTPVWGDLLGYDWVVV